MISTHVLAIEGAASPDARELEGAGDVLVDERCHIENCATAAHSKGSVLVGWLTGQLRVHTHDSQSLEEERREPIESGAARHGSGDGREVHVCQLFEHVD